MIQHMCCAISCDLLSLSHVIELLLCIVACAIQGESQTDTPAKNLKWNSVLSFIIHLQQQTSLKNKHHKLMLVSVSFFRNGKPKNRPSFQQVLLHVEIAAGDVLKTPQEVYLNQQVSKPSSATAASK